MKTILGVLILCSLGTIARAEHEYPYDYGYGYGRDYPDYKTRYISRRYYSGGWYPYGGVQNPAYELSPILDFFDTFSCDWVESSDVDVDSEETTKITGYPIRGCMDGPVCHGTTRCKVTFKGDSGEMTAATFFVENTICSGPGVNECENATKCVREGGVFNSIGPDVVRKGLQGEPKVFNPGKIDAPKIKK